VRKLKVPLLLSLAQSAVALAVVIWSHHIPDIGVSYARIYVPILLDACRGISAPAFFLSRTLEIKIGWLLSLPSAISFGGYELPLEAIFFIPSVFAFWFIIGRAIDCGWTKSGQYLDAATKEELLLDAFLVLYGVFLLVVGAGGIWVALRIWRRSPGSILDGQVLRMVILYYLEHGILPTFAVAWSAPLLFVPGRRLVARARSNKPPPPPIER
jgi:hypothetical protein